MEWISVKDELPEDNERVLVCYGTTGMGGIKYFQNVGMIMPSSSRKRFNGEMDWTRAYYWMPLPKLPTT